MVHNHMYYAIG